MSETILLQLTHSSETHQLRVPLRSSADQAGDDLLSYELVLQKAVQLFPRLASSAFTVVYRDDEGDIVTLSHALEFSEACRVLLDSSAARAEPPTLHFYILAKVSLRDKVAPVLSRVVELARLAGQATQQLRNSELLGRGRDSIARLAGGAVTQAGHAIEHLRNSEMLSRGRESLGNSAGHTRTILLLAGSGVSTRIRRAGSAVAAELERRRSSTSRESFDPTEFEKPTTATTSPSTEVVDLRHSVAAEAEVEEVEAVEGAQSEEQTAYESDADTLCDEEEDRGLDVEDSQWAAQLAVIREVMVHVDEELCCDLLAQHQGNVESVLAELTDM